MIINFTADQDFEVAIQKIEENKDIIIAGNYAIGLNFPNALSRPVINEETVSTCMARFTANFPFERRGLLSFEDIRQLDATELKAFLSNSDFRGYLSTIQLKQIISYSNELADFALGTKDICARLDDDEKDIESQTFAYSCAARCLLNFMLHAKLITPEEHTRSKELQIYRQIWSEPGKMSDPLKLIDYCKKNNISVMSAVHQKQIDKTLANLWFDKEQALSMFGVFKRAATSTLDLTNASDQATFMEKPALLIDRYMHAYFAKKDAQGRIEVMDTDGDVFHYTDVDDLFKDERFSGVALSLQHNASP